MHYKHVYLILSGFIKKNFKILSYAVVSLYNKLITLFVCHFIPLLPALAQICMLSGINNESSSRNPLHIVSSSKECMSLISFARNIKQKIHCAIWKMHVKTFPMQFLFTTCTLLSLTFISLLIIMKLLTFFFPLIWCFHHLMERRQLRRYLREIKFFCSWFSAAVHLLAPFLFYSEKSLFRVSFSLFSSTSALSSIFAMQSLWLFELFSKFQSHHHNRRTKKTH